MKIVCCEKKGGDSPSLLHQCPNYHLSFENISIVFCHMSCTTCVLEVGDAKKNPRGLIYNLRFPVTSKKQNIFSTRSPSGSEHTYKQRGFRLERFSRMKINGECMRSMGNGF